jgi:hypothetical protein
MSRQAFSCAVLLLVVPLRAEDSGKPAPASGGDSWAPLSHSAPPSAPASFGPAPTLRGKNAGGGVDHPPEGYHDVNVAGGVIRVSNAPKSSGGEFSGTSSFANKSFSAQDSALSKSITAPELGHQPFLTHSFGATAAYNQSDRTFETAAYHPDARSSDNFNKAYTLPDNQNSLAKPFAVKSSDLQDKQALIGQKQLADPFATPWTEGDKKFYDPALRNVKRDPYAGDSLDVSRLTNLPNRPLTVDEVRSLINHEQIPDLNSKPDAASRALNDPDWAPPLKLPEMDEKNTSAPPPADETKDGELPSPGMMAQPAGALPPQK